MINNLLKHVNIVANKHEEITKSRNENFNLFNVMNMRTDEVKTHSSIIAELMNPKGSHNLNDIFLNLFLQKINKECNLNLSNSSNTKVYVEYYIGKISENFTNGGRIDILLSNQYFNICIENKINAHDEPYQLRRYHNYLCTRTKKTILIYLTPDGKEASNKSTCISQLVNGKWEEDHNDLLSKDKEYFCISYKSFILAWLEECYIYTIDKPILRESLKQYIILIRSLTNQSKSIEMAKEIQETILTDIKSAKIIYNSFFPAFNGLISSFCEHLRKSLIIHGFKEESIEFRNWKNEDRFFSVFIKKNESENRIGFEIYNGSLAWGDSYSMIDIENENWGKQPRERWDKEETYNKLSNYFNGNSEKKSTIINEILNLMIDY